MIKISIEAGMSLSFSQSHQQKLNKKWNKIVNDPFAFTPHEKRGVASLDEVVQQNLDLGQFASAHLKKVLNKRTFADLSHRMRKHKKIVAVGYGRGYDSNWLKEAIFSGYEIWWIDVSDLACKMAEEDMKAQYEKIVPREVSYPKPIIKHGEIQSILADPAQIDLNLSSVEIWYFSRMLTCMSERSMRLVLQWIGASSFSPDVDEKKKNKIVIVGAMRDYNPDRVGKSSKLYFIRQILKLLSYGAGRPLIVVDEAHHMYFDQICTAMTIGAK